MGSSGSLFNIQDFYNSPKNGKKIVMLGDSTVISGANGGPISARFAKYQEPGNCLESCIVENQGAIGKTLNKWVNNEPELPILEIALFISEVVTNLLSLVN